MVGNLRQCYFRRSSDCSLANRAHALGTGVGCGRSDLCIDDPAGPASSRRGNCLAGVPVGPLTAALVLTDVLFNRLTGRKYPLRQSVDTPAQPQEIRLGLSNDELEELLARFHQSTNIGAASSSAAASVSGAKPIDRVS